MKKTLTKVISVYIFLYLLGAFVSASFNLAEWEDSTRDVFAFLIGAFALLAIVPEFTVEFDSQGDD